MESRGTRPEEQEGTDEGKSEPNPCDHAGGHGDGKDRLGGTLGGKRHSKTTGSDVGGCGAWRMLGLADRLELGPIRVGGLADLLQLAGRHPTDKVACSVVA